MNTFIEIFAGVMKWLTAAFVVVMFIIWAGWLVGLGLSILFLGAVAGHDI